ncbi:ABC transporter ATP-binding protein [Bacilliculturomica massiliensis]|uniref:ABC transporter ATP-binding protein n=1 Tax=Bacilliculturomica massiliensis TaxID=1917867 RepID=UPI0010315142|nr:ABC transporter ATP-binding protein [Bacilliculturomica massiliensis]
MENILDVKNLHTYFYTKAGVSKAVNGVNFSLREGEILGIIGESGSGKSVAVKSILQIVPRPGKIAEGQIIYRGRDLLADKQAIGQVRGKDITMIFQEPMTSLNPVLTIGRQLTEGIRLHLGLSKEEANQRACEFLKQVKITNPEELLTRYPHHLSGGMRQRVMIAMALATDTKILIADEATTALDVTIQQQIIYLLKELRDRLHMSIIFITHDMGVINEIADNTAVMYCGKIQEYASTYEVMKHPRHPYTEALLKAIPSIDAEQQKLSTIPGSVPSLLALPEGCSFSNRCTQCTDRCREEEPKLIRLEDGHRVRCWKYDGQGEVVDS